MRYTFNRGEWSNGCALQDWEDGEGFDDYLRRINFKTAPMEFGGEGLSQIQIYESDTRAEFLAHVCLNNENIYEVYLPDFPSMMMFIRDHAAAFSVETANTYQQDVLQIIQKFFQAIHGHDAFDICKECDPNEWQKRLKKTNKSNTV